jgi:hypothetical protein
MTSTSRAISTAEASILAFAAGTRVLFDRNALAWGVDHSVISAIGVRDFITRFTASQLQTRRVASMEVTRVVLAP